MRAGLKRARNVELAFGSGEHHGPHAGRRPRNAGGGIKPVARQADIEQHDIGAKLLRNPQSVGRSRALRNDFNIVHAGESLHGAFTKHRMVINDCDADRARHLHLLREN